MKTDEDDEFDYIEQFSKRNEIPLKDIDPYADLVRNQTIEEIARKIEDMTAFGADTVSSFATYIRGMKR